MLVEDGNDVGKAQSGNEKKIQTDEKQQKKHSYLGETKSKGKKKV